MKKFVIVLISMAFIFAVGCTAPKMVEDHGYDKGYEVLQSDEDTVTVNF